MSKELNFDHFKNIEELLEHIDIWYKEDDIDYTRWFHLEDLKKVKDYITNLQQENKQLKEDFAVLKKLQMISNDILTELEEWLKQEIEHNVDGTKSFSGYQCKETLDKIQELKERY